MPHAVSACASRRVFVWLACPFMLATLAACDRGEGDVTELAAMELVPEDAPASPTNALADDPAAAELGRRLFFDRGLSVDGTIACASCHDPARGFSDPRPRSIGVRGQEGDRHALPITAVALQSFFLWDGRADSLWSQPLKAIENEREMDLTRVELARHVASSYRTEYEAVFGALPRLDDAPARAKPSMPEWDAMPESQRDEVNRIAANVGKAIEAYERTLLCADTRFDRWVRGEVELSDAELAGAATFVESGCSRCHAGPAFSDGAFHNVGVPSADRGRADARDLLASDPFNGAGTYSDDPDAGRAKLATLAGEPASVGAFRTPSLRGVGQRAFFGHAAHEATLAGFVLDVYQGGGRGGGGDGDRGGPRDGDGDGPGRVATVGTLDPLLDGVFVRGDVDDLVVFLRTLDCPAPPASSLRP